MSKYIEFSDVQFADQECLVGALKDVGYTDVEVGENLHLYGYHGDRRSDTAEVVVRRKHIGQASNDLGFARRDGALVPIISEYDQHSRLNTKFLTNLKTAYAERSIETVAQRLRGSTKRTVEGGKIVVKLRY